MTTENGVPTTHEVRMAIKVLGNRREYLVDKLMEFHRERPTVDLRTTFLHREIEALDLAMPLLEDQWSQSARIQKNLEKVNALHRHQEMAADPRKHQTTPPWRLPVSTGVDKTEEGA